MTAKEQFKLLDLSNAFLFSLALSDPEICSMILETILEQPVGPVWVQRKRVYCSARSFAA